ncbi:MAG: hypothetical protein AAF997_18315, partial [Myxococcota bacterium]
MVSVRRGGLVCALLLVGTAVSPRLAGAQDAEEPPEAVEEPASEGELDGEEAAPDAEDSREEVDAETDAEDPEIVTEGVDGDEWITPDVAAAEEEQEENAVGDVDEVIINYDENVDAGDVITDAQGKEVPDVPVPVVSKTV